MRISKWIIIYLHHVVLCNLVLSQEDQNDPHGNKTNKDIWLLGLFPFSGSWPGGLGQLPAVEMGLRDVNADPNMLPGYTLHMTINDTAVSIISYILL